MIVGMTGGCKKPPVNPITPMPPINIATDTTLNIIWQTKISSGNEEFAHNYVKFYNNQVLIAPVFGSLITPVTNYNASNGNIINDLGVCNSNGLFTNQVKQYINSFCNNKLTFYNLDNKQLFFEYTRNVQINRGDNDYTKYQNQNHILRSVSIQNDSTFMILKSKWQTGIWDTIFHDKAIFKNYEVFNNYVNYWLAPNGDSILVITHSMLERNPPQKNIADMLCYNLKTKQVYWHLPNFTPSGLGGALSIKDSKIYLTGASVIYCYDLITKQKIWEYYLSSDGDGFGVGDPTPIFDGNRMYTKGQNDYAYCLDKNTGQVIWKSKHKIGESKFILHKGVLYCLGTYLNGIRASDGKNILFSDTPKEKEGCRFTNGLDLDPATDRLFCADSRYVYAIDISRFNQ
jgi:outer membrane protein assembly factor BamB